MADKKHERRGLGRGLSALMADVGNPENDTAKSDAAPRPENMVEIERIKPNVDQPRRQFLPEQLEDLANSIRVKGVIQPLIVRVDPQNSEFFQIVAGERRWRAAQMAQVHAVPVVVRDLDDVEVLEIAIIENIQRSDLNPVEEAAGYRQLMDRFGHTQEKMSEALGKSRSHIANLLRLLNLPEDVLGLLASGALSMGHARALITGENPSELARIVTSKGLSVRQAEALAKKSKEPQKVRLRPSPSGKDADTLALENDLSAATGMSVKISLEDGKQSGTLSVSYKTLEELDEVCRRLSQS